MRAASCPMERILDLYRRAAVYVDKILKAPNLLIFQYSRQRSLSL